MTTEQVVRPGSILSGSWEQVNPLPVDGSTYIEPKILAVSTAGYFGGDSNAAALVQDKLILPDVGTSISQVELVGTSQIAYTGAAGTSWNVPYPSVSGGIKAFDLLVIDCISQELTDPGPPLTPVGWTTRGSFWTNSPYIPRVTRFFKMAAGGESGTVTVSSSGLAYRPHFFARVLRGVDITAYFDSASAVFTTGQGGSQPDPGSITTATPGAFVEVLLAANIDPGGAPGFTADRVPGGFTQGFSSIGNPRGVVHAWKRRTTAGAENPSPFAWTFDNWTTVVDTYKPAMNTGLTLVVLSLVSDTTATGIPSPAPFMAQSEVQRVSSVLTSGTFTLTWNTQTTAPIAWNASASTVQAALEGLAAIGVGDVLCFGGPLNTDAVTVVFQGALANQDVSLMTASSGSVTIAELERGHAVEVFAWEGSVNCPRWSDGPAWLAGSAPQINIWGLTPASYVPGTEIDVTVSDHGANQTWGLMLLVIEKAKTSNPISDTFGSAAGALGVSTIQFGAITPPTPGAKIVAVAGQSTVAAYGASPPTPSPPARYRQLAAALSDRSLMTAYISPPAPASSDSPGRISWVGNQDVVTGLFAIDPAGTAGTLSANQVLSTENTSSWLELAFAAGSMYEIYEFNLAGLPANPWLVSAQVEFSHLSNVRSPLRCVLVGIRANGSVALSTEQRPSGYTAEPLGQAQTAQGPIVTEMADGTPLSDFTRLAVAFISTERNASLETHKLYWARLKLVFEEGRPVITNVVGPATAGAPISWSYSSSSGLPQAKVQVRVIAGSAQNPATATPAPSGLQATTGQIVYDSGVIPGASIRSLTLEDAPLGRGVCTVAVQAWAQTAGGSLIPSGWSTADFDIAGSPPTLPDQAASWQVVGYKTYDTAGQRFARTGFNGGAAISLPDGHSGKFGGTGAKVTAWAYEGFGGPPDYPITPDIWPGAANIHSGTAMRPGSNFGAYTGWSQQSLGWVSVPDRAAPLFGTLTTAASGLGMTLPPVRSWMAPVARINAHPVSGPYTWIQGTAGDAITDPAPMIAQYVDQAEYLASIGFLVNIELHEMTGTDPVMPAGLVSNPVTFDPASLSAGPIKTMLLFYDALAARFQGATHNVWIGLPNEAYAGAYSTNYKNFIISLIRRLRGKGFGGIITWPLPQFAGNLALLASGGMDDLWDDLVTHGVEGNQRPEWHFYGTDYASAGTGAGIDATYSAFKTYLEKCRDGTGVPGSTAHVWAVYLGEFGRPTPDGSWDPGQGPAMNAILNARTIVAVDIIGTTTYGTPLGQLFPDISPTLWSSGDNSWRRNFSPTWGSVNKGNPTGPDPHTVNAGHTTGTFPPHDIPYLADPYEWLTDAGAALWDLGPLVAAATGTNPGGGNRIEFNVAKGTVDVEILTPAGASRAWLIRSIDGGGSWQLTEGSPFVIPPSSTVTLRDAWVPAMVPEVQYMVSLDNGPMTETSAPVVLTGDVSTMIEDWYLVVPSDPDLSTRIEVAGVQQETPIRTVVSNGPAGAVVASSRPLAHEMSLTIRARDRASREAVLAALESGLAIRVVTILGQEWLMRVDSGIGIQLQRWKAMAAESTKLRDAHELTVKLIEVRR